jgi:hypothetical protein
MIVRSVVRERRIASATVRRSPETSVRSEAYGADVLRDGSTAVRATADATRGRDRRAAQDSNTTRAVYRGHVNVWCRDLLEGAARGASWKQ